MLCMEESTRKKIYGIEITAAVVLILFGVISIFPNPGITGYVSIEIKTQEIDLTIANSQSYILTTNSKEPFYLTSLQFSGEVIGDGSVKVYVDNGQGQKILIFSNIIKKDKGLDSITGMNKITGGVVGTDQGTQEEYYLVIEYLENIEEEPGEIAEDKELAAGNFKNKCVDTCFIEMLLSEEIGYQLLFYVEEGTILRLDEIVYNIRKD